MQSLIKECDFGSLEATIVKRLRSRFHESTVRRRFVTIPMLCQVNIPGSQIKVIEVNYCLRRLHLTPEKRLSLFRSNSIAINPSLSPPHREAIRNELPPWGVGGGMRLRPCACNQPFIDAMYQLERLDCNQPFIEPTPPRSD